MAAAEEKATLDERLAAARAARNDRDKLRKSREDALELEELELEAKYEAELGPRGTKFEIVSNDLGCFVVKLGEFVAYKRFNAKGADVTEEDVIQLVTPALVHPDRFTASPILRDHAGIAWDLALAMQKLFRAKREVTRGK